MKKKKKKKRETRAQENYTLVLTQLQKKKKEYARDNTFNKQTNKNFKNKSRIEVCMLQQRKQTSKQNNK